MSENPQQRKKDIWNPGLDGCAVKEEENKNEARIQLPPLMMDPFMLHMFSILQQQRQAQQNNQPKGHQLPSFLQLLQANQALNTRGLRSDIGQVAKTQNLIKKPPKQKQPSIHQLPSSNLSSNPSSNNPIVDSVLGNLTSPVNYNACAICSMSFRLTTDLVAHMRTNHRSSRYKRKLTTEANED